MLTDQLNHISYFKYSTLDEKKELNKIISYDHKK